MFIQQCLRFACSNRASLLHINQSAILFICYTPPYCFLLIWTYFVPNRRNPPPSFYCYWIVPEKIHTLPKEEISAVQRGRGDKIVSDNSKCIRTSEGGRGGGGGGGGGGS
jgi:hypothetical protein